MTVDTIHSPARVIAGFSDALAAAEAYAGATAPNPPVGCVVLDAAGTTLAIGAHQRAGQAHAEAAALAACYETGVAGRIHTLLVTLEPCNHHGRTPPCVEAILASPARRVWIATPDPNPTVAGGGAARLRDAGLDVRFLSDLEHPEAADLVRRARRLIAPFALWARERRPWLTVKQAINRQGDMIPPPGQRTFTSESSLSLAHALRRRADAIITGSGTVLADAPAFTVRRTPDPRPFSRRLAILDRRRRTPPDYIAAAEARGFRVSLHDALPSLVSDLAADGVLEALVECGPTLLASVLETELWDEHVVIRQADRAGSADDIQWFARTADQA
jgi:diaminohydroxyphosphoribosylaminopyrimidine deaminase/5-amino-6-(5-phosphoribosylamino)uracil reductase